MMNRKVFTDNLFMFKVVLRNIPFYVIGNLLLTISGAIINAYTNIYLIKYVVLITILKNRIIVIWH